VSIKKIESYPRLSMGADPEIFLAQNGQIIGGEKMVPKEGLKAQQGDRTGAITLDGVQVELHPSPTSCRVYFGGNLQASFKALKAHLEKNQYSASVSFAGIVEVPQEELDALSDQSKRFGCVESENIYGKPSATLKTIDPEAYRIRTAGGHIHVGLPLLQQPEYEPNILTPEEALKMHEERFCHDGMDKVMREYYQNAYKDTTLNLKWWQKAYPQGYQHGYKTDAVGTPLIKTPGTLDYESYPADLWVPAHDILVGNTCVMLDRDEGQIERRKLYGRAGEYRKNDHGYEYRTLSNFWLRSYPLTSLVFGLSRLANAAIFYEGSFERKPIDELLACVEPSLIAQAINENNLELAQENWQHVKKWIKKWVKHEIVTIRDYSLPLDPNTLKDFDFFLSKPLTYWWSADPLDYWTSPQLSIRTGGGWESFLLNTVRGARQLALADGSWKELRA
jgi:hypothetical protein